MKNLLLTGLVLFFLNGIHAQVAMDFNMSDCNNNMHHLYTDYLDNEEVVIIEYFMLCSSCIETGQRLSPMFNQLSLDYPGKVNFFAFNFNDDLACSVAIDFVTLNGINAVPFDSGATQLDYYGGFGMPSVVIVGGSQHEIIYFSKTSDGVNDTTAMDNAIRDFFITLGNEHENEELQCSVYPNPVSNFINLELNILTPSQTQIVMVDSKGKVVKNISNLYLSTGIQQFQVETSYLSNGIYFVKILSNGKTAQYKISVIH